MTGNLSPSQAIDKATELYDAAVARLRGPVLVLGETGAGKTVLAHALDLLLGGRARSGTALTIWWHGRHARQFGRRFGTRLVSALHGLWR